MTREEITSRMVAASSVLKMVCGIGNNAAWMVVLEAIDHARLCRLYRGDVKRLFKRSLAMFHEYERRLIYADTNRLFHIADMTPEVRKKYGDITDRQFYEMWAATGTDAYQRTRPMITSLWNKYRLSLLKHGVRDAEHVAWVMTAMAALELSVNLYRQAIHDCRIGLQLPEATLERVFSQFSLAHIAKTWMEAMLALAPDTGGYELDHTEDRNIEMGLQQLRDAWLNTDTMYTSTMKAVEDYEEVFRTKGEQKKALREIAKVRNATEDNL